MLLCTSVDTTNTRSPFAKKTKRVFGGNGPISCAHKAKECIGKRFIIGSPYRYFSKMGNSFIPIKSHTIKFFSFCELAQFCGQFFMLLQISIQQTRGRYE